MENNIVIKSKIKPGSKIYFKTLTSGEKGSLVSIDNYIIVTRGKIYYIPINNIMINLDDFYIFKTKGEINELIDVRNIRSGYISIIPIVPNFVVKHDQELGIVI